MFRVHTPDTPPFLGYGPLPSVLSTPSFGSTTVFSGTQAPMENADDFSMYSLMGAGTYPWNLPILENISSQPQWFGPGMFARLDYPLCSDGFDLDGIGTYATLSGGMGWPTDGVFSALDYPLCSDGFDLDGIGTYATLSGGMGWPTDGVFSALDYLVKDNDDFQSYSPGLVVPSGGTITGLGAGNGWSAQGTFVSPI